MSIQLTSNCCLAGNAGPADPRLRSLFTFNETLLAHKDFAPVVVRQRSSESDNNSADGGDSTDAGVTLSTMTTAKSMLKLAPRNPAVALTVQDHEKPFSLRGLAIVSSARTIEVYRGAAGEYLGTFQGEPWSRSTSSPSSFSPSSAPTAAAKNAAATVVTAGSGRGQEGGDAGRLSATAPLFLIRVDSATLASGATRGVMIKFFIPKRPVEHQDTLTIHEINLIEATMLGAREQKHLDQQQEPASSHTSSKTLPTAASPSSPHSAGIEQLLLSSGVSNVAGNGDGRGVDMAKVRELMGDLRIDQLPPGARDLMQAMEQQSLLRQTSSSNFNHLASTTPTAESFTSLPSTTSTIMSNVMQASTPTTSSPVPIPSGGDPPSLSSGDPFGVNSASAAREHRGSYSSIYSDSSVTSPLTTGDPNQLITREDLRLLETRIMHAIDRKLSQLEERIMAKLYARNRL